MNKSDFFIVLILLILMGVWMYINPRYISPPSVINEETKIRLSTIQILLKFHQI